MVMETRGGQTIVVADSDRTVLELLQIRLDVAGYHTCVARTGVAVLDTLKYMRPAALVIDTGLGDMTGFEVLQALSQRGSKLPCPTLVLGRKLVVEDIKFALSLGARDCMVKPFSGAEFLDRMHRLIRAPSSAIEQKLYYV